MGERTMPLHGSILITGGAGTLGHAIVRQACSDGWECTFTIVSRSELRQARMRQRFPRLRYVLADVRDARAMDAVIAGHETVIHAAAMKRIPECETQPQACLETNVIGSSVVAATCVRHGVATAIAISTDKACLAATAYGHSKGLMVALLRAQPRGLTRFVAVRYGNVVASNGSVIPIWREQHATRQPLTLTDERMTRFWMAPTDAVCLIERTAAEGQHGEVWIPKMHALGIRTLAQMICPGAPMTEVGLR
jgi:UDP-N-acetylglucosamine 4,6-dehydratase